MDRSARRAGAAYSAYEAREKAELAGQGRGEEQAFDLLEWRFLGGRLQQRPRLCTDTRGIS